MKDHLHCPSCGAHGLHDLVDVGDGVIAWCHTCWHRHVPERRGAIGADAVAVRPPPSGVEHQRSMI